MLVRKAGGVGARPGTVLAESAVVYPVVFLLLFGIILGGLAVFRYQQMAHAAREASRWAAVHGAEYAKETGLPAATAADVYANVILPQTGGIPQDHLQYAVTWNSDNRPSHTAVVNGQTVTVTNTVTVTVSYTWDLGLFGPVTMSSTSVSAVFH